MLELGDLPSSILALRRFYLSIVFTPFNKILLAISYCATNPLVKLQALLQQHTLLASTDSRYSGVYWNDMSATHPVHIKNIFFPVTAYIQWLTPICLSLAFLFCLLFPLS